MQFDLGSAAERPEELARPHLHELLEAVYPHYDLVCFHVQLLQLCMWHLLAFSVL